MLYQPTVNFAIRVPGYTTAVRDVLDYLRADILAPSIKLVTERQWTERNVFLQQPYPADHHFQFSFIWFIIFGQLFTLLFCAIVLALRKPSLSVKPSLSLLTFELDWSIVLLSLWADHWQTHGTIAKQPAMSMWDVTSRNSCVLSLSDGE